MENETSQKQSLSLSPKRKRIFSGIVMVIIPLLFFLLLELILNITGFGYSPDYFTKRKIRGRKYYSDNLEFSRRFFPKGLTRPSNHFKIPVDKSSKTFRIVVLGGSAAMGDPAPSFSFSRILDRMLEYHYPNTNFEVTNLAVTAINSNVVLPIARDCKKIKPDLFIIYLGNNEVIGPFGPGTVFEAFSSKLSLIRANIFLKSTRIGQLLSEGVKLFQKNAKDIERWQGINMFLDNRLRKTNEKMDLVYEHFRKNLKDIKDIADQINADIIFSTVATNLKDNPPFGSLHDRNLSNKDTKEWDNIYTTAKDLESKQKYAQAIKYYRRATKIDSSFAGLHFRLARCYLALKKFKKAKKYFIKARDVDALRFRADTKINIIIRNIAKSNSSRNTHLLDADSIFMTESQAGVAGDSLFYDHVHMNFKGNYLLAQNILQQLSKIVNKKIDQVPLPYKKYEKSLAFTEWEQFRIKKEILRRLNSPAFANQIDNRIKVKKMENILANMEGTMQTDTTIRRIRANYQKSINEHPQDWIIRNNYGAFLLDMLNEPKEAINQFQYVIHELPYDYLSYSNLGLAYARKGRVNKAKQNLNKALEIKPNFPEAHLNLGKILESQKRYKEVIEHYKKANVENRMLAQAYNKYGKNLFDNNETQRAISQFKKAIEYAPDYSITYNNLGNIFLHKKQPDSAKIYFSKAIEHNPKSIEGHLNFASLYHNQKNYNKAIQYYKQALDIDSSQTTIRNTLGLAYCQAGKYDIGIRHFKKALEEKPEFMTARNNLISALNRLDRYEEAIAQLREVLEINPNPALHNNLGALLLKNGKIDEAITHFKKALDMNPNYKSAKQNLNYALSRKKNRD